MSNIPKDKKIKAFSSHRINTFRLTFPNGNWISTVFGLGTYSDNHDALLKDEAQSMGRGFKEYLNFWNAPRESNTAEIMIECPKKLHSRIHKKYEGDGSVIGYLSIKQWLEIVKLLSK